jgi:hypothetical protein
VLDNSGWGAVKEATLKVYPDGHAKDAGAYEAALCPDVEFSKIAEAFGIQAEKPHRPRGRSRCTPPLRRCRPRRSWCTAARAGHTDLSEGRAVASDTKTAPPSQSRDAHSAGCGHEVRPFAKPHHSRHCDAGTRARKIGNLTILDHGLANAPGSAGR